MHVRRVWQCYYTNYSSTFFPFDTLKVKGTEQTFVFAQK
jgi:hypothetical protein